MNRLRLMLPCPKSKPGKEWGDHYFGLSLAEALERRGKQVRIQFANQSILTRAMSGWQHHDVDLVLRGRYRYRPRTNRPFYIWLISQSDTLTDLEIDRATHFFVASAPFAEKLRKRGASVSVLLQATGIKNLQMPEKVSRDVLFVGNRRPDFKRPVVRMAGKCGVKVNVWGRGWENFSGNIDHKGNQIANADLGFHYSRAGVVLNDHTSAMFKDGFVSNRVFDVLAAGRPILTEEMNGIPDDLRPFLYTYSNEQDFAIKLNMALNETEVDMDARRKFAKIASKAHGFDERAKQILEIMMQHKTTAKG